MIYLVEHFYSIQGEGKYTGTPSVFFRFGGCNLKCEGFGCVEEFDGKRIVGCDTVYAVDKAFLKNWTEIKKADELIHILKSYNLDFDVDVVFTGGEPLLYANDEICTEFLEYLYINNHRVTFETNATVKVDFEKNKLYKNFIYALSVKLANSHESYTKRIKPDVIASIAENGKEAFFKFSIDKDSISIELDDEIDEIVSYAPNLDVYCMPLGGSKKEVEENTPALIEYCKEKGYKFSDRLHIRVWDSNKGV